MQQRPSDADIRAALPEAADHLASCRAGLIGDDVIERYVALDWIVWDGGSLKLTQVGRNIIAQVMAGRARAL